jgi:voltage-gated potassium channel
MVAPEADRPEERRDRMPRSDQHHIAGFRAPGGFTILLTCMLFLVVVLPFFEGYQIAITMLSVVTSAIVVAAIYAGATHRRELILSLALASPPLLGRWLPWYQADRRFFLLITVATALFLAYSTVLVVVRTTQAKRVTLDTVAGALCGYMLIGMTFALAYSIVQFELPNSFRFAPRIFASPKYTFVIQSEVQRLVYYSFVTLTTTGYGDITATSPPTRALTVLEAMTGQMYLVVLVARLVALEITHSGRDRSP